MGIDWAPSLKLEHAVASIISQQEANGVLFAKDKAISLLSKIAIEKEEIAAQIKPMLHMEMEKTGQYIKKPFLKAGGLSGPVTKWYESEEDRAMVWGPFQRIDWVELDMSKREKFKDQLMHLGWLPTRWTDPSDRNPNGRPQLSYTNELGDKVPCESLVRSLGELGETVTRFYTISHRESQINGWVYGSARTEWKSPIRADGRIPAGANPCGTNTGRATHKVVANIPRPSSVLGKEMRSLFMVPNDRALVGSDLAGLELRCLAHRMGDYLYTQILLNEDIHWHNTQAMELVTQGTPRDKHNAELEQWRDAGKKILYTFLYGGGLAKIAETINGTENDAKHIKEALLTNLPSLEKLIDGVKKASKRGWLKGIDGRKVWMRRNEKGQVMVHKALNTLLQSDGAIISKVWLVFIDKLIISVPKYKAKQLWWIHDEVGIECLPEYTDEVGELLIKCAEKAGRFLKMSLPITAGYDIGRNWSEVH